MGSKGRGLLFRRIGFTMGAPVLAPSALRFSRYFTVGETPTPPAPKPPRRYEAIF